MKRFAELLGPSKLLIFLVVLLYAANSLSGGAIYSAMALNTGLLRYNLELWRLVSYPLAPAGFESLALFFVTFFFISPKLEKLFHGLVYPLVLLLLTLLQGTLMSVVFWNTPVNFAGMEGLSFFVLALFLWLKPQNRIVPMLKVSASMFILPIVLIWLGFKIPTMYSGNISAEIPNLAGVVFGIMAGSLTGLQIRYVQKLVNKKTRTQATPLYTIPKPEELSLAMISAQHLHKVYSSFEQPDELLSEDSSVNEDRLNTILDKILETGKESLTVEEVHFLEQYSKQL